MAFGGSELQLRHYGALGMWLQPLKYDPELANALIRCLLAVRYARCPGNGHDCSFRLSAHLDGRLEQLGKPFDPRDEPRSGTGEVAVGFHRVYAAIANRRNRAPLFRKSHRTVFVTSLFGAIPARRNQQDFRRSFHHMFDSDPERRRARTAEKVLATGAMDHFGDPVAAHIKRLQPLEKRDARTLFRRIYLLFQNPEPRTNGLQQRFRLRSVAGFFAHPKDVAPHVAQILRVEAKHFRPPVESRKRSGKIVRGSGAHMAQILSDDQIRRQRLQYFGVHRVQALTAMYILADKRVNLRRRSIMRYPRMNHDRLRARLRRKIAFVADAHNLPVKPKRKQNLSG